jgi:hypothetical protein
MPEGHTIHRLARDHARWFAGHPVQVSSPQGRFADAAARLDGRVLVGTDAYGKHLFHRYEGEETVHVHLGLFGRFLHHPAPPPEPRETVRYRVVGGDDAVDLVGATACELLRPDEVEAITARLGPDPIRDDADPERAWEALRAPLRRHRAGAARPAGARRGRQRLPRRDPLRPRDPPGAAREAPPARGLGLDVGDARHVVAARCARAAHHHRGSGRAGGSPNRAVPGPGDLRLPQRPLRSLPRRGPTVGPRGSLGLRLRGVPGPVAQRIGDAWPSQVGPGQGASHGDACQTPTRPPLRCVPSGSRRSRGVSAVATDPAQAVADYLRWLADPSFRQHRHVRARAAARRRAPILWNGSSCAPSSNGSSDLGPQLEAAFVTSRGDLGATSTA